MNGSSFVFLLLGFVLLVALTTFIRKLGLQRITVFEYQRGALFLRGAFTEVLPQGRYWTSRSRQIQLVDMRLQTLQVAGQEVLTADVLPLKITLAGEYRITDPRAYLLTSTAPSSSLYQDAQQALREAVAGMSFDNVLDTRTQINARLPELMAPKAARLGIEMLTLELRDIMLPGELKKAYAQAITAQKEGLAAMERARAEVASLRALANAARLMQDNPGLLQLRAVQAIETTKGNTLTLEMLVEPQKQAV